MSRNAYGITPDMDQFTYNYNSFTLHGETRNGNRLQRVDDNPSFDGHHAVDFDDSGNQTDYTYNSIGQMVQDNNRCSVQYQFSSAVLKLQICAKTQGSKEG